MGEHSHIEWTDHTFNPWRGCTKVSPGCAHCYAETLSKRNPKVLGVWGKGQPRVLASEDMWRQPLKWNEEARSLSVRAEMFCEVHPRPRVFCASLADWLDDEVPIEWLARLLNLIHQTPYLDWQLLTKRPQNFEDRIGQCAEVNEDGHRVFPCGAMASKWINGQPPYNVWLGVSVESQKYADERIPLLLAIPAKIRFLSCEPLLGPVDLTRVRIDSEGSLSASMLPSIQWVICGGESGPDAQPMHPHWARSLRDQCQAAGVPFFFKQWGEYVEWDGSQSPSPAGRFPHPDNTPYVRVGKLAAGRLLDGRTHDEFPAVVQLAA